MSNGEFAYTAEQTAALFAQFSKAMELARERQRDPMFVSRQLQPIIDPNIVAASVAGVFHVIGNFSSAAEAIDAGDYPVKWGYAEKPDEIPLIIQPVDCFVRAVPLGRLTKARDMFSLYPRMIDPMTAFTFGVCFPEEQRKASHITLWMDTVGELWYVSLDVTGRPRLVRVRQVGPGGVFLDSCRVLVREFSPPQAA